jgi:hypothetical protein
VGTDVTKNRTERNSGDRDMKILFKGKKKSVLLKDKEKIKGRKKEGKCEMNFWYTGSAADVKEV